MPNAKDQSFDELLVILVQSGDRKAGERLAARWHPRLLRTARRVLGDDDLAREACQDAWISICRGIARLREPDRFPAFAHRILARRCTDRLRHVIRRRDHEVADDPDRQTHTRPGAEAHTAIQLAFDDLSPDHRLAAVLFFVEGLTLPEISSALEIPVGTAKSRLFHARQHLKRALERSNFHE